MAELLTQARLPISELEDQVRRKYGLKEKMVDFRIEGDALVLFFSHAEPVTGVKQKEPKDAPGKVRRRRRGKRNRMKTRGWDVVAKIKLANGQTATIYQPFVTALSGPKKSPAEQRSLVAQILRDNGNRPEEGSIEYYLSNTLAYLESRGE